MAYTRSGRDAADGHQEGRVDLLVPSMAGTKRATVRKLGHASLAGGLICFVSLLYLLWRNAPSLWLLRGSFEARFLIVGFVFHGLSLAVAAYVWHLIVALVAGETNQTRNLRIYVTTAFARRLPGSLWGPALRMYWYQRLGGDWRTVGIASVLEVWALTLSGAVLSLVGALLFVRSAASVRDLLGLIGVLGVLAAVLAPPINAQLISWLARLFPASSALLSNPPRPSALLRWAAIEVLNWIAGGLVLYAILRALTNVQPDQIPTVLACWAVAGTAGMLITFVPGGFGVVELALTGLLSLAVPAPVALAAALGLRLFITACECLWMAVGFVAPYAVNLIRSPQRA